MRRRMLRESEAPAFGSEISVGRFESFMRNLFSIKRGGLLTNVHGGVVPTVDLGGRLFFEQRLMQEIRSYSVYLTPAAPGAGNVNVYELINPAGSGLLVVLEEMHYSTPGAAAQFIMQIDITGAGGTGLPVAALDTRMYGKQSILALQSGGLVAVSALPPPAVTRLTYGYRNLANTQFPIAGPTDDQKIVLSPGFKVAMFQASLNQADTMSLSWYERPLEPSERE